MDIKISIDLETALQNAITAAVQPDKLQDLIQGRVEEAVKAAVNEATGYNSPFRKTVLNAITSAMPSDIDKLGRMSDVVLKILSAQVEKAQNEFVTQAMAESIAELIPSARREVKLSDLVREMITSDSTFGNNFTFEMKESGSCAGYWSLDFGPARAGFTDEGKCFSLMFDGYDCNKRVFIGTAFGSQKVLLGLYTQQTVVIRDVDQYQIYDIIEDVKSSGSED